MKRKEHLTDILRIERRNILRWQILENTAGDKISQTFFCKNSEIILGNLTEYGKMLFYQAVHGRIRHIIAVEIFLNDLGSYVTAGTWLIHKNLKGIRGCSVDIFPENMQDIVAAPGKQITFGQLLLKKIPVVADQLMVTADPGCAQIPGKQD